MGYSMTAEEKNRKKLENTATKLIQANEKKKSRRNRYYKPGVDLPPVRWMRRVHH
jgi:hypothetical protein